MLNSKTADKSREMLKDGSDIVSRVLLRDFISVW